MLELDHYFVYLVILLFNAMCRVTDQIFECYHFSMVVANLGNENFHFF